MFAATVPTFQRLIEGVQRKKTRETLIVAAFIAVLLCFTIWCSAHCSLFSSFIYLLIRSLVFGAGGYFCGDRKLLKKSNSLAYTHVHD